MWPAGCPEGLPKGFEAWLKKEVVSKDRTIFFERGGTKAVCNFCHKDIGDLRGIWMMGAFSTGFHRNRTQSATYKVDQRGRCPSCGELVDTIMHGGASYGAKFFGEVCCIQVTGKVVWIKQFSLRRNADNDHKTISKNNLLPSYLWRIEGRDVYKWEYSTIDWIWDGKKYQQQWKPKWWICGHIWKTAERYMFYLPEGLSKKLKGTSLEYADPESWRADLFEKGENNLIRYLIDFPRFRAVEKLYKAGYKVLIAEKDRGYASAYGFHGQINWNAKTVQGALHLPNWILRMKEPKEWTYGELVEAKKELSLFKSGYMTKEQLVRLQKSDMTIRSLERIKDYVPFDKALTYFSGRPNDISLYVDYIKFAELLEWDLDNKDIRYPENIKTAHDRAMRMANLMKDKEREEKMRKAAEMLEDLIYEDDDYIIRPALSMEELSKESDANNHCVGRSNIYVDKMIRGESAIFFIRHKSTPDVTWFTCEFSRKKHELCQCRTKNNVPYTTCIEVMNVMAKWFKQIKEKQIYNALIKEGAVA